MLSGKLENWAPSWQCNRAGCWDRACPRELNVIWKTAIGYTAGRQLNVIWKTGKLGLGWRCHWELNAICSFRLLHFMPPPAPPCQANQPLWILRLPKSKTYYVAGGRREFVWSDQSPLPTSRSEYCCSWYWTSCGQKYRSDQILENKCWIPGQVTFCSEFKIWGQREASLKMTSLDAALVQLVQQDLDHCNISILLRHIFFEFERLQNLV